MNSNETTRLHRIETGDWVGSAWRSSPKWTPYAQAIADHYPIQVPWYSTHTVTPNNVNSIPTVVVTRPNLYDVLIVGASAAVISVGDPTFSQIGLFGLQVTHKQTGIPWVAPNTIGFQAPEWITMPNGNTIPVGSRLPWFGTIPFGTRNAAGRVFGAYSLNQGQQVVQFLPPSDCSVEIHDAYTNVETGSTFGDSPILLTMKITDMRAVSDWTPGLTPVTAVFGNETQVFPDLPFTKPHLLKVGHRTAITMQNNSTAVQALSGTVTLRGVRLCEY